MTATATKAAPVHLGFEVGTGKPVAIPLRHMVVTGQSQEAGKTTTLEALIERAGIQAVAFITKRGEGSFKGARTIRPYFSEQVGDAGFLDWKYVSSVLEASLGEKLKFERSWIMRATQGARSLADVLAKCRAELEDPKVKGLSRDMYFQLSTYLGEIVPVIQRTRWAERVELAPGLGAMDLDGLDDRMQFLVIRSTIDWVLRNAERTVVVVPEAWKFIPQGRGTPVKLAAETFIRQGAGLGNYLWLDSQDIAGVDKPTLKQVPVWILGVQREKNEVQRTLDQIPVRAPKPTADQVAQLGLGEFFACYGTVIKRVYVQPAWMHSDEAQMIARGRQPVPASQPAAGTDRSKRSLPKNEEPVDVRVVGHSEHDPERHQTTAEMARHASLEQIRAAEDRARRAEETAAMLNEQLRETRDRLAQADASLRAVQALRSVLEPQYRAMQSLFGQMEQASATAPGGAQIDRSVYEPWFPKLYGGARKMLEVLIDRGGELTVRQLALFCQRKPGNGAWRKDIGQLRSAGLVGPGDPVKLRVP